MLRCVEKLICFSLRATRRVKTAETSTPDPQPQPKPKERIRFDQKELAALTNRRNAPKKSVIKAYEEKVQQKLQNEQQKDQGQVQSPQNSYEMKKKRDVRQKFKTFRIYRKSIKTKPQGAELDLKELSKVRLPQQYLPQPYMRKVQKIFHKYDQAMLRDIALHFNTLMKLRYHQEKFDYDMYPDLGFKKLEQKLPKERQVEQIYLMSKEKLLQLRGATQQPKFRTKIDSEPIQPQISYTQNVVIAYLLNRTPRTYAVAYRLIHEVKSKFPTFKPKSFIDFGAGLSSGSCAFIEHFGDTGQVYSVQPGARMRKLGKYLTDHTNIQHYETLGELSTKISKADIVYAGYVLNELQSDIVEVYLESLWLKVNNHGFLILVEFGNPFGSRIIHEARKWALGKQGKIAAPCPHQSKCPLARNDMHWCHFEQPSGMYPSQVFGKLPTDNAIKLQKFSYLIIQKLQPASQLADPPAKSNITEDWDRVMFPLMKKGGHFIFNLCTKSGLFDRRITSKSHGLQFKEGRKLKWGDFWRFGKRIPNKFRKQRRTGKRLW